MPISHLLFTRERSPCMKWAPPLESGLHGSKALPSLNFVTLGKWLGLSFVSVPYLYMGMVITNRLLWASVKLLQARCLAQCLAHDKCPIDGMCNYVIVVPLITVWGGDYYPQIIKVISDFTGTAETARWQKGYKRCVQSSKAWAMSLSLHCFPNQRAYSLVC